MKSAVCALVAVLVLAACPRTAATDSADATDSVDATDSAATQVNVTRWCSSAPSSLQDSDSAPAFTALWSSVNSIFERYKIRHHVCGNLSSLGIKVTTHRVFMDDGAFLWTIVINPVPSGAKRGAVLCRSPYGPTSQNMADIFVGTNKQVAVLQDDRGTWRSNGTFDMWRNSRADARATMAWLVSQEWSNGDVYTVGASADGISTATLIFEEPKALKGQWFMWTTMEGHEFVYPAGTYRMDILEGYMKATNILTHNAGGRVIDEVRHHESHSDWWYNLTACRDLSSPHLPQCHFQQVHWPVVMTSGWWDIFQMTQIDAWKGVRKVGDPRVRDKHVLIVAALGHCTIEPMSDVHHPTLLAADAAGITVSAELASEFFLGNTQGPVRSKIGRINLFLMGAYEGKSTVGNYWTSMNEWPTPSPTVLYLQQGNKLNSTLGSDGAEGYTYDPKNPTPMAGGTNLPGIGNVKVCGTADQSKRDARDDVVLFESDALLAPTAVVGNIAAKLFIGSSANDTDFVVTLSDVRPSGFLRKQTAYLVRYGGIRMRWRDSDTAIAPPMSPNKVYEVDVDMGNTAYVFEKGHRIRLSVSSAAAPYVNPNSNTGKFELVQKVTPVVAHNTVHFGTKSPSSVALPIVPLADLPKSPYFTKAMEDARAL